MNLSKADAKKINKALETEKRGFWSKLLDAFVEHKNGQIKPGQSVEGKFPLLVGTATESDRLIASKAKKQFKRENTGPEGTV